MLFKRKKKRVKKVIYKAPVRALKKKAEYVGWVKKETKYTNYLKQFGIEVV